MNKNFILIAILALFLVSCGKNNEGEVKEEETIFTVKVANPVRGHIEERVKYLGNIEADNEVNVYSALPRKITSIQAEINDMVKKDKVLATVKNVEVKQALLQTEAALSSAKAQLENVKTEWERTVRLYEERAISKSQYDAVKAQKEAAEANVKQAEAAVESTREQYENSFIKAPIAGMVSRRNYDMGEQTSPQMPAFTIVDMNKVKIKVNLVEKDIYKVQKGNKAYIEVVGMSGKEFEGNVSKIHPTVDPQTRTVEAEIVVDNTNLQLRPGMYAKVYIVTENADNALLVPSYAIIEKTTSQWQGGEIANAEIVVSKFCFVARDGKAVKIDLETGITDENNTQVLSGLTTEDDVIVIGQHNLSDGQKVKVVTD